MKGKILGGIFTILIIALMFCVGFSNRIFGDPIECYQVYLDGKKIGMISSKDDLLALIDNEQTEIKEKYNVDKVYPPNGLDIKKIYTYDEDDLVDVTEIYRDIKDIKSFTISGYTVKISYNSAKYYDEENVELDRPPVYIYMMDKDFIKTALYNTALVFVSEEEIKNYENGTQEVITDTGTTINSIYFDETITVKEDLISTNDYIFKDAEELSKYLLYGTLDKQKTYIVKSGDNLEKIANNNKINIKELLIANPDFVSEDILLAEGDVVNVGYVSPLVSVITYKTEIKDVTVAYKTTYIDEPTKYTDYKVTTVDGVNGLTRTTQEIKYNNGEIQELKITTREVLKEPVDKVITRGTKSYSGSKYYYSTINSGDWTWPTLSPFVITSRYGYRTLGGGTFHKAVDISGTGYGSPIYSATDGVVISTVSTCPKGYYGSRCGDSYGNYVKVRTVDNYTIIYAHLADVIVKAGDNVNRGQLIGHMGTSGSSTGTHLHFQINAPNGSTINPCSIFKC